MFLATCICSLLQDIRDGVEAQRTHPSNSSTLATIEALTLEYSRSRVIVRHSNEVNVGDMDFLETIVTSLL